MPSPLFTRLLAVTRPYMDEKKAAEVIERQIAKIGATADTLAATHLGGLRDRISSVLGLYVSDAGKREEMVVKLKAFA
ncbi:MAG: hypothetical protein EXQ52_02115 [Bryobacterales bacterium]|nr:hypothetical protein [Bryobacterales bacterium]